MDFFGSSLEIHYMEILYIDFDWIIIISIDWMKYTETCFYDQWLFDSGEAVCGTGSAWVSLNDARSNSQGASLTDNWSKCLEKLIEKPEWGIR